MKVVLLAVVLSIGLILELSCSAVDSTNDNVNSEIRSSRSDYISKETAVLIAKGFLCLDYDLRDREIVVTDGSDAWHVQFVRTKNLQAEGGDPLVRVSKDDGRVLYTIHGK